MLGPRSLEGKTGTAELCHLNAGRNLDRVKIRTQHEDFLLTAGNSLWQAGKGRWGMHAPAPSVCHSNWAPTPGCVTLLSLRPAASREHRARPA